MEKVVAALSRNPNVEYAEPNGIATIWLDPNDPYDNTQCYNSSRSGCVTRWARIAVVDTGIDNSHPDLPAVILQKDFIK